MGRFCPWVRGVPCVPFAARSWLRSTADWALEVTHLALTELTWTCANSWLRSPTHGAPKIKQQEHLILQMICSDLKRFPPSICRQEAVAFLLWFNCSSRAQLWLTLILVQVKHIAVWYSLMQFAIEPFPWLWTRPYRYLSCVAPHFNGALKHLWWRPR